MRQRVFFIRQPFFNHVTFSDKLEARLKSSIKKTKNGEDFGEKGDVAIYLCGRKVSRWEITQRWEYSGLDLKLTMGSQSQARKTEGGTAQPSVQMND